MQIRIHTAYILASGTLLGDIGVRAYGTLGGILRKPSCVYASDQSFIVGSSKISRWRLLGTFSHIKQVCKNILGCARRKVRTA